ncbi:MAG: prepilin-type N-terminal cleavage/methylation domain-containing protein [Verrucomicrobiota bacterium]
MRTAQRFGKQNGFTLVEIMVVIAIVGLLATITVCNIMVARDTGRIRVIQRNLTQIESAKTFWALDNNKNLGDPVADVSVVADYIRGGKVKQIVSETYVPNPIGTLAEAALPVGVALGSYAAGASIPTP